MCWINIWAYTHWLSLRGRCKYRNYTHAYFTGIRQIAHLAGSDDRPAPNLCLHRRQQKERLCHVCAEKLGHEKATSFPPLRSRIHSRSTVSTSRKLFEKCNQIYERSGEAVEQLIAKHTPPSSMWLYSVITGEISPNPRLGNIPLRANNIRWERQPQWLPRVLYAFCANINVENIADKNKHQKTTHRQTSSSSLIVVSSFGLSNFKLRGVLSSLRSRLLCTWDQIIHIVPKNKQKKAQKLRMKTWVDNFPSDYWVMKDLYFPPRCLRHSPRLSSWVQRGQAGCAARPEPDASSSAEVKCCYTTSPGSRSTMHMLFGAPEKERKKESEKAQLSEITAKKSACWWRAVSLHPLPSSTWIPWC